MEAVEKTGLCELIRETIKIDDIMVAGTEYLRIPKYSGIKLVPAAANANVTILNSCWPKAAVEKVPGINSKYESKTIMETSTNTLEMKIVIKVNKPMIHNLTTINFFLGTGYVKRTLVVLFLNSSIMNFVINTAAKIINVALTNVPAIKKASS